MPTNYEAIVHDAHSLKTAVLAAAPTGQTAFDCVAFFTGADANTGAGVLADWVVRTSTQALGTSWKVTKRGRYLFTASIPITASVTVLAGLSYDAGGVEPGRNPAIADASTRDVGRVVLPAATEATIKLAAMINVTQTDANTPTLGIFRLLLSDGADTSPAGADITLAEATISIARMSDCNQLA